MQILVFVPVAAAASVPSAHTEMATWLSAAGANDVAVTAITFTKSGAQLSLASSHHGETAAALLVRLEKGGVSRLGLVSKFAHAIGAPLRRCKVRMEGTAGEPVELNGAEPSTLWPADADHRRVYVPRGGVPCMASGTVMVPNHTAMPNTSTSAAEPPYRDRLLRHFKALGNCTVTANDGDVVELVADGFRGEVLKEKKAWERLQISMLVSENGAMSRVFLAVDGQFAPGIGAKLPPLASYRDMDSKYFSSVQTYAKALLTEITNP